MPNEQDNLPEEKPVNGELQPDPELEDMRNTSSEPNKSNQQVALNAGSELNDNKANSSRARDNN